MSIDKKLEKLYSLSLEKQRSFNPPTFSHFAILQLKELAEMKAKLNNTNADEEFESMIDRFISSLEKL